LNKLAFVRRRRTNCQKTCPFFFVLSPDFKCFLLFPSFPPFSKCELPASFFYRIGEGAVSAGASLSYAPLAGLASSRSFLLALSLHSSSLPSDATTSSVGLLRKEIFFLVQDLSTAAYSTFSFCSPRFLQRDTFLLLAVPLLESKSLFCLRILHTCFGFRLSCHLFFPAQVSPLLFTRLWPMFAFVPLSTVFPPPPPPNRLSLDPHQV